MDGGSLCHDFQGYHSDYAITPGKYVTYAVVGALPAAGGGPRRDRRGDRRGVRTRSSRPRPTPCPQDKPAYDHVDDDHRGLGAGRRRRRDRRSVRARSPTRSTTPPALTTLVQRVWSNAAAAASHDPCQPDGASPYFNSAAGAERHHLTSSASPIGIVHHQGGEDPRRASSQTVELDLYSDAPTSGPWKVSVIDCAARSSAGAPDALVHARQDRGAERRQDPPDHQGARQEQPGRVARSGCRAISGSVTTVWLGLVGN